MSEETREGFIVGIRTPFSLYISFLLTQQPGSSSLIKAHNYRCEWGQAESLLRASRLYCAPQCPGSCGRH